MPFGGGSLLIIASKISSIPSPVFPEQGIAFVVSIPTTSSISFFFFLYLTQVNLFYLIRVLPHDLSQVLGRH